MEFAIIVPLLLLFLCGLIDFGTLYSNQISLRNGVREGAREAVVANWGAPPGPGCLHNPTGSSDIQALMCETKSRVGLGSSDVYVDVVFDGAYGPNSKIIVCAETPAKSVTGAFATIFGNSFLRTKVEMTVETASSAGEAGGSDLLPSGLDWSWCTPAGATP